jgi:hypothetical protein
MMTRTDYFWPKSLVVAVRRALRLAPPFHLPRIVRVHRR